ncbi:hypothetical protein CC2G_013735 [Coprinopsis cinerea AmutBmut pab1-1]|nr:hypothetical protein CC2G_013735 [Coprinopsis cinerea AmutBmut pab1-1]
MRIDPFIPSQPPSIAKEDPTNSPHLSGSPLTIVNPATTPFRRKSKSKTNTTFSTETGLASPLAPVQEHPSPSVGWSNMSADQQIWSCEDALEAASSTIAEITLVHGDLGRRARISQDDSEDQRPPPVYSPC